MYVNVLYRLVESTNVAGGGRASTASVAVERTRSEGTCSREILLTDRSKTAVGCGDDWFGGKDGPHAAKPGRYGWFAHMSSETCAATR